MQDNRFHRRWAGKALHTAMWGLLRLSAIRRGIDPGEPERVREYLRFRYQLDRPLPEDPFQRPRNFLPGLTARPWHEATDFGWTSLVEESAEMIRDELVGLLGEKAFVPSGATSPCRGSGRRTCCGRSGFRFATT